MQLKNELPCISIQCPSCNDTRHETTLLVTKDGLLLKCNKCNTTYNLVKCKLVEEKLERGI